MRFMPPHIRLTVDYLLLDIQFNFNSQIDGDANDERGGKNKNKSIQKYTTYLKYNG